MLSTAWGAASRSRSPQFANLHPVNPSRGGRTRRRLCIGLASCGQRSDRRGFQTRMSQRQEAARRRQCARGGDAAARERAARKRAAVEMIAEHEGALRRTARRYSIDAEDAEDAYQRALEIVLTKAPTTDAARADPLDADGDQARGAGAAPQPRAAAGHGARTAPATARRLVALIPSRRRRPRGAGRAARGDRPQPRGAAGAEAGRAARADPARRGLLLRRDRRDHRLQSDQVNRCLAEGRERFRGLVSAARTAAAAPSWGRCSRPSATARRAPRDSERGARAPARLRPLPRRPCAPTGRRRGPRLPWRRCCRRLALAARAAARAARRAALAARRASGAGAEPSAQIAAGGGTRAPGWPRSPSCWRSAPGGGRRRRLRRDRRRCRRR